MKNILILSVLIAAVFLFQCDNTLAKNSKKYRNKEEISLEYFDVICDSLSKPDNAYYLKMFEKYQKCKSAKEFDAKSYRNVPLGKALDLISNKYDVIQHGYDVDEDGMINGMFVDYFLTDKLVLEVWFCFNKKVKSCCGMGGEFTANNTLHRELREKNDKIIENVTGYKIYQFKRKIDDKRAIYFYDEEVRYKWYIRQYKANKLKKASGRG